MTSPNYRPFSLSTFIPSTPSLLFLFLSVGLTFPKPSDAAVFIKGTCCKIRTPAKRVRDYLVLPPPSHFHPRSVRTQAVQLQDEPSAKFSLIPKYMIDIPQLSFHFERLDLMDIYFHSTLTTGGGRKRGEIKAGDVCFC